MGSKFSPKSVGVKNSQKIFRVANFPVTYMDHLGTAPLYLPANLPDPNTSNLFWSLDKKLPLTLAEKAGVFLCTIYTLSKASSYNRCDLKKPPRSPITEVTSLPNKGGNHQEDELTNPNNLSVWLSGETLGQKRAICLTPKSQISDNETWLSENM